MIYLSLWFTKTAPLKSCPLFWKKILSSSLTEDITQKLNINDQLTISREYTSKGFIWREQTKGIAGSRSSPSALPRSTALTLQMAEVKALSSPSSPLSSQGCLVTFILQNEVRNLSGALFTWSRLSDSSASGLAQSNLIWNWWTAGCLPSPSSRNWWNE